MARKTDIINFSIPRDFNKEIDEYLKKSHKTRSEFIRELLHGYFDTSRHFDTEERKSGSGPGKDNKYTLKGQKYLQNGSEITELDLANILRFYWEIKSKPGLNVISIVLGIVINENNKVLIGARGDKNEWVENLTWVFPGGRLNSLDFEKEIVRKVKGETGLDVSVKQLVSARIHPDSGFKNVQIVALYFYCNVINGELVPGGDLIELKWVKPMDVFKYFTTSTNDEVSRFLAGFD